MEQCTSIKIAHLTAAAWPPRAARGGGADAGRISSPGGGQVPRVLLGLDAAASEWDDAFSMFGSASNASRTCSWAMRPGVPGLGGLYSDTSCKSSPPATIGRRSTRRHLSALCGGPAFGSPPSGLARPVSLASLAVDLALLHSPTLVRLRSVRRRRASGWRRGSIAPCGATRWASCTSGARGMRRQSRWSFFLQRQSSGTGGMAAGRDRSALLSSAPRSADVQAWRRRLARWPRADERSVFPRILLRRAQRVMSDLAGVPRATRWASGEGMAESLVHWSAVPG